MVTINRQPINFFVLAIFLFIHPAAHGLTGDTKAPINVQSDSVSVQNKVQQATYTGNVTITQGSIKIQAHKVVIKAKENRLQSADIYGTSAKHAAFQQTTDEGQTIIGTALHIQLDQVKNVITLSKHAKLDDGKNTLSGETITYNSRSQITSAKSSNKTRVRMTFLPPQSASDK